MRRILTGSAMATLMAVISGLALAGNQEVAEQIAQNLRQSGQISDYKIGVKYQDGTAWLRGRVNDEQQVKAAMKVASKTHGVKRVVNELTVAESNVADETVPDSTPKSRANRAERVPSSYTARTAEKTSMQESSEVLPQRMAAPARMKPMATERVAMQSAAHGPTAPTGAPLPMYSPSANPGTVAPSRYDQPCMPNYAWPSYASYPNYAGVTYPKQYSPTAWPYIGPFYPYPQVPLGWRKVTLEWDDGWWFLDFKDQPASAWHR